MDLVSKFQFYMHKMVRFQKDSTGTHVGYINLMHI
jgi:hypothetical protein